MNPGHFTTATSKHHDGFALWDTKYGDFNAVRSSTAKKNVLTPIVESLRREKLKVGIYYSLPDWYYNDYTHFTRDSVRYKAIEQPER